MKGKKMIITAIAVGYFTGEYCSYAEISKSTYENFLLSLIAFCATILTFYLFHETKSYFHDNKNEKESRIKRQKIEYHNLEHERAIEEFKTQRKEFFDNYFNDSIITMKVMK